jgi:hypothetical protein
MDQKIRLVVQIHGSDHILHGGVAKRHETASARMETHGIQFGSSDTNFAGRRILFLTRLGMMS